MYAQKWSVPGAHTGVHIRAAWEGTEPWLQGFPEQAGPQGTDPLLRPFLSRGGAT